MVSSPQQSRLAETADSEEVADLLDRFQAEFDEYTPGVKVLAPRVWEHIAGGLSVFLLAGPPHVGVAQLRFREYLLTGAPMCYLEELYVVPERRGEGHGRMLMESALHRARARGATTMELGTAVDDTAARRLYESFGSPTSRRRGGPRRRCSTTSWSYERRSGQRYRHPNRRVDDVEGGRPDPRSERFLAAARPGRLGGSSETRDARPRPRRSQVGPVSVEIFGS